MNETPSDFKSLVEMVVEFINILIPLLFAGLFVFLMWKVIDAWVLHAGDETKRSEGKKYLIAAVFVFVVMVSAWGIVALVRNAIFG